MELLCYRCNLPGHFGKDCPTWFDVRMMSFDDLPNPKPWDHAIELIPGGAPSGCKVYPLSPSEQKELNAFLKENLETGRIQPSKSPMASPVFFIKKKDGAL